MLARRLPCLVVALAAFRAAADAPAPADYWITQADGHVQACPSMRACPDDGLLRRNADTGEIVLLTTCARDGRCFLDECVPAGTYQYGLATPYACYASGAYWYRTASVAGPPPGCVRTLPEPAPAESVPWTDGELICASSYHRPTVLPSCGCGSGGVVLGMQGLAVALGLALAARGRARRARK